MPIKDPLVEKTSDEDLSPRFSGSSSLTLEDLNRRQPLHKETHWVCLTQNSSGEWIPKGSYNTQEFQSQIRKGAFKVTDYCWRPGWKDWKSIFDEPTFYTGRKPPLTGVEFKKERLFDPIHIPSVEKIQGQINPEVEFLDFKEEERLQEEDQILKNFNDLNQLDLDFKVQSSWPEPLTPRQYKGDKYKKGSKNKSLMLDPWEPRIQEVPFVDPDPLDEGRSQIDSLYKNSNLDESPFERPSEELLENSKKSSGFYYKVMFITFMGLILGGGGLVFMSPLGEKLKDPKIWNWIVGSSIPLQFSYLVIGEYSMAQPQYLFIQTDLKKGRSIRVRFFDFQRQLIKTKKGNSGLKVSSTGRGNYSSSSLPL